MYNPRGTNRELASLNTAVVIIMKDIIVTLTTVVGFNCELTLLRFSTCKYKKMN